mgnify:CR=1 FL=1
MTVLLPGIVVSYKKKSNHEILIVDRRKLKLLCIRTHDYSSVQKLAHWYEVSSFPIIIFDYKVS